MNKNGLIKKVNSHRCFFRFLSWLYNSINIKNKLRLKKGKKAIGVAIINGLKIYNYGKNNEIFIGDFVRIKNCKIILKGDNNKVCINDYAYLIGVELWMEDSKNQISIGKHSSFHGSAHLAVIEGTKIEIGDYCLFSNDLHFRTGDSHSILDANGMRINKSEDIIIKNNVWIGTRVTCLKGVYVAENSIVGATTTLCKKYTVCNSVIAGNPGKVLKTNIRWCAQRV